MKNIVGTGSRGLAAGAMVCFAAIWLDVSHGGPLSTAGRALAGMIVRHRNPTLDRIMVLVTMLGDSFFLFPALFVVLAFFSYKSEKSVTGRIAAHALLLYLTVHLVKVVSAIPRPHQFYGGAAHWAFPSGHAAMAFFFYGLLVRLCGDTRYRVRRLLSVSAATLLIIIIGFSRVYLGAHWPGDVLAGYCLGLAALVSLPLVRERETGLPWHHLCLFVLVLLLFVHWLTHFSSNIQRYLL